ncbi:hypothetical protein JCM10207_009154 [Rhodosporidiobolus poonsookiae]
MPYLAEVLFPPAPLPPTKRASSPNAPTSTTASSFVAPSSRRGPRDFKLAHKDSTPAISSDASASTLTTPSTPSTRPARAEYSGIPPPALDILATTPPSSKVDLPALVPTSSTTTTTSSSRRSIQPAPPVPHPHFMFQSQTSYPRRPKTADSQATNASKSSFSRAFRAAFGMSSSSSSSSSTKSHPASASTTTLAPPPAAATPPPPVPVVEVSKRLNALDLAKDKGKRAVAFVKRKLNSKSPKELLPKTWAEWDRAYGNYEIDIEDPPAPPLPIAVEGEEPTAFQKRLYVAPLPPNEIERQNVVNRLDLFGTKEKAAMNASQATLDITASPDMPSSSAMVPTSSTASRSSYLTTSEAPSSRRNSSSGFSTTSNTTSATSAATHSPTLSDPVASLQGHPAFRSLVLRAKEVFQARVSAITVLDDNQQLFLASGGMPEGVPNAMPRSASFCSHAILNEERGLVVLNSTDDWRFASNLAVTHLGARFYAGVPVMARAGPNDPSVPIGTLCVLDDKPREEFTEAHRRVLRDFATQASNAIEQWAGERMAAKMARLHGSFTAGIAAKPPTRLLPPPGLSEPALASPPLTPPPSAGFPPSVASRRPKTAPGLPTSLPSSPQSSIDRHASVSSHSRRDSDVDSTVSSVPSQIVQPRRPTALSLGVTTDDPISTIPRDVQKQFDTAVKMLAKALDIELVYLASLDLTLADAASSSSVKLRILSSFGLPVPPPSFDPALHLKALRAPEGGLLYKNPRFSPESPAAYASGILIPVLEVRRTGYVLCGYTRKEARDFAQRDLTYFVRFAEGLEAGCIKASKTSSALALAASST